MIAPRRPDPQEAASPPGPSVGSSTNVAPTRVRSRAASPRRRSAADRRAVAEASALPGEARLVELPVIVAASGASLTTVRYWIRSGRLRATRLDRRVRVRLSDWLEFLERSRAS